MERRESCRTEAADYVLIRETQADVARVRKNRGSPTKTVQYEKSRTTSRDGKTDSTARRDAKG